MREILNYLIEANVALLLFLVFYKLFLQNESNFRFLRFFMLGAIFISLTFPLIHVNNTQENNIPSIGNVVPEYWLPGIVVGNPVIDSAPTGNEGMDAWQIAGVIYSAGVCLFFIWLTIQLGYVLLMLRHTSSGYKFKQYSIIESAEDKPTFSFFNLIYIGRADALTPQEKEQIIRHESVHASQLHSLDILIVTMLGIIFWFNPIIKLYKKIFIQLHEFEADARAVENSDVDMYCSLLARVALQTHFPIASHFNESLTVKRIEMMRTIKKKIRTWKIVAAATTMAICFVVIACQDQVIDDVAKSTISQKGDYPAEIKAHMDDYLKDHPDAKLTYLEGAPDEIDKLENSPELKGRVVYIYKFKANGGLKKGILLTNVVQYAEKLQTDDKVFVIVEQQPEFPGGYDSFKNFLHQNIKYPKTAAQSGKTGVVYVAFIINADGAVSDANVLRGVTPEMDAEALRVINLLPKWNPGTQNGKAVKVRFTMPISFGAGSTSTESEVITSNNYKMKVNHQTAYVSGKTIISGKILGGDGKPLSGANVILTGTTTGTTTNSEGDFKLEVQDPKGKLSVSHIGYDFETIDF